LTLEVKQLCLLVSPLGR